MIEASTRLHRAILLNDVLLVQRILRNHPSLLRNPDFDDKSNTSLHLAASHGLLAIVDSLIHAGHEGDPSTGEISRNAEHDTPLMLAARNGHVEVGRALVEAFPRCVPMTNHALLDALALASQTPESTALIPVLLCNPSHPASPHSRDMDGNTPLHHASASGSLKALRILLSAGANPLAKNNYDWTPLAYSQTVAAEVYFKNLVAEFERRKVEGMKAEEERERQRAAGVRVVEDVGGSPGYGSGGGSGGGELRTPIDEDELIGDALKRHWSPTDRRRPATPGSGGAGPGSFGSGGLRQHEWGSAESSRLATGLGLTHMRTRSGSGDSAIAARYHS